MFEEVEFKFLVVGHSHENIDECFGYLSKNLRKIFKNILVDLMKSFMIS